MRLSGLSPRSVLNEVSIIKQCINDCTNRGFHTTLCEYSNPSTFSTGTITQSKFCARSCTAASSEYSSSFSSHVAVADVIHSRAWMFASMKMIGLPCRSEQNGDYRTVPLHRKRPHQPLCVTVSLPGSCDSRTTGRQCGCSARSDGRQSAHPAMHRLSPIGGNQTNRIAYLRARRPSSSPH